MTNARDDAALWFLNSHVRVLVSGADNADAISVLEHRLPLGDAPPVHVHHDEDEIFHVIAGRIRYVVGGRETLARAGDTLLAPRGVPHGFRVVSPEGAHVLTITRGGFERMVRGVSRPAQAEAPPRPVAPSSELQARLAQACAAERIDLLGPPIA